MSHSRPLGLLLRHLQPLALPESHYTAMADLLALRKQQRVYSAVAVASVLACETPNIGRQGVFIILRLWNIAHGITGNAQRLADTPSGVVQHSHVSYCLRAELSIFPQ